MSKLWGSERLRNLFLITQPVGLTPEPKFFAFQFLDMLESRQPCHVFSLEWILLITQSWYSFCLFRTVMSREKKMHLECPNSGSQINNYRLSKKCIGLCRCLLSRMEKRDILWHFDINVFGSKFPAPLCFSSVFSHPTLHCWRGSQLALIWDVAMGRPGLVMTATFWAPAEANRLPQGWHAHMSNLLRPGSVQICNGRARCHL